MNAKEARDLTISNENPRHQEQLNSIQMVISNAIERGEFFCYYSYYIFFSVRELLKAQGFIVGESIINDGITLTKISW